MGGTPNLSFFRQFFVIFLQYFHIDITRMTVVVYVYVSHVFETNAELADAMTNAIRASI